MEQRIQLYIHLPYCIHRCRYCTACVVTGDSTAKRAYLEALERELNATLPTLDEYLVASIYVGGGSPSVMRPDDVAKLLRAFKKKLRLEQRAEVTIELMPQTVGTPSLSGLNAGGINRYSLSMQSIIPSELEALDCGFSVQDVQNAVLFLDKFHHNNVNIDIMYGNPGQTLASWTRTLQVVRDFSPSHVSVHPFPGEADSCPDDETKVALEHKAASYLTELGYQRYTVHHYAKPNRACRHFLNRYQGMEYIGFGLGARSFIDGLTYENTHDLATYLAHSGNIEKLATNIVALTPEELEEYYSVCKALLR
ncbi:MAG: hypothetical protein LBS98_03435 [Coriobacteriales bacterium]|jgi:oxygen-independent coproporphyrinogen-3 oxidase|nr:hypothetical protein [Coriobacteriales bacterium]